MMLKSLEENGQDPSLAINELRQIDDAWVDSLTPYLTDCKEYRDFKAGLTDDVVKDLLRTHFADYSSDMVAGKKKILREKELEIAMRNVKRLKLFMHTYQSDPDLVEQIRRKLNSIIREYYGRGNAMLKFHEGAHPEYIMNSFIYNPWKDETNFKVLRIDRNQVTYQPYRDGRPHGNPVQIRLDEFLKIRIPIKRIGEVYKIFPELDDVHDYEASYNEKVDYYLERLMETFEKKPDTEVFSVPPKPEPNPKSQGGRRHRTHHKCHNNKKKRTHKRRG